MSAPFSAFLCVTVSRKVKRKVKTLHPERKYARSSQTRNSVTPPKLQPKLRKRGGNEWLKNKKRFVWSVQQASAVLPRVSVKEITEGRMLTAENWKSMQLFFLCVCHGYAIPANLG